jgi:putative transposase
LEVHVTYQLRAYTDKAGYGRIDEVLAQHRDLYNSAVLERKWAREWVEKYGAPGGAAVTYNSQSKELTALRAERPEWKDQNRRLATGTLWRVEKAFQAFFRRVNAGETPGYPRLKPPTRFRTLETRGIPPGALKADPDRDRLYLRLKGLPSLAIPLKGRAVPATSQLKTITITRKGNRCMVSLGFMEEREPLSPTGLAIGLDMRLNVARVVTSYGEAWPTRVLDNAKVKRLHRKIARAKKGSRGRAKTVRTLNNHAIRELARDYNEVHRFTSRIVANHELIAIEDLDIRQMTRSARGTVESPGENVALSADLNRRVYEQTWGEIRRQLIYKAEWAGRRVVLVDPADTSRTCSGCGHIRSLPQESSTFRCGRCGLRGAAAHNAAINILRLGLRDLGEGGNKGLRPALDTPQDLVSIRALAWMRV